MKRYFVNSKGVTVISPAGVAGHGFGDPEVVISGPDDETWSDMTVEESLEWYKNNMKNIIDIPDTSNGSLIDIDADSTSIKGFISAGSIFYDDGKEKLSVFVEGVGSRSTYNMPDNTNLRVLYLDDSSSNSNNERTEDMSLNTITPLTEYTFKVASVEKTAVDASHNAIVITLAYQNPASLSLADQSYEFVQTEDLTEKGIAVKPYGAILLNELAPTQTGYGSTVLALKTPGGLLETKSVINDLLTVGATVTFAASEAGGGGGGGVA